MHTLCACDLPYIDCVVFFVVVFVLKYPCHCYESVVYSNITSSHVHVLQITLQLQGLFLFSLVWSIAGTITGDSRKKFDVFFRTLISGTDAEHPKPKTVKLTKVCVCGGGGYVHACACVCVCVSLRAYNVVRQSLLFSTLIF